MTKLSPSLIELFNILLDEYGFQNWWPVDTEYHKASGTNIVDEIIIGAVLAQNTSWKNVEKALQNFKTMGKLSLDFVRSTEVEKLKEIVRPAGFFNQKANTLKNIANFLNPIDKLFQISREDLLGVKGIGQETADVILLYAANRLSFVVDKYTQRLIYRVYNLRGNYQQIKSLFEANLPKDKTVYKEFHALIDQHAKERCKKQPICDKCILRELCAYSVNAHLKSM